MTDSWRLANPFDQEIMVHIGEIGPTRSTRRAPSSALLAPAESLSPFVGTSAASILALHRLLGNHTVQRLAREGRLPTVVPTLRAAPTTGSDAPPHEAPGIAPGNPEWSSRTASGSPGPDSLDPTGTVDILHRESGLTRIGIARAADGSVSGMARLGADEAAVRATSALRRDRPAVPAPTGAAVLQRGMEVRGCETNWKGQTVGKALSFDLDHILVTQRKIDARTIVKVWKVPPEVMENLKTAKAVLLKLSLGKRWNDATNAWEDDPKPDLAFRQLIAKKQEILNAIELNRAKRSTSAQTKKPSGKTYAALEGWPKGGALADSSVGLAPGQGAITTGKAERYILGSGGAADCVIIAAYNAQTTALFMVHAHRKTNLSEVQAHVAKVGGAADVYLASETLAKGAESSQLIKSIEAHARDHKWAIMGRYGVRSLAINAQSGEVLPNVDATLLGKDPRRRQSAPEKEEASEEIPEVQEEGVGLGLAEELEVPISPEARAKMLEAMSQSAAQPDVEIVYP